MTAEGIWLLSDLMLRPTRLKQPCSLRLYSCVTPRYQQAADLRHQHSVLLVVEVQLRLRFLQLHEVGDAAVRLELRRQLSLAQPVSHSPAFADPHGLLQVFFLSLGF